MSLAERACRELYERRAWLSPCAGGEVLFLAPGRVPDRARPVGSPMLHSVVLPLWPSLCILSLHAGRSQGSLPRDFGQPGGDPVPFPGWCATAPATQNDVDPGLYPPSTVMEPSSLQRARTPIRNGQPAQRANRDWHRRHDQGPAWMSTPTKTRFCASWPRTRRCPSTRPFLLAQLLISSPQLDLAPPVAGPRGAHRKGRPVPGLSAAWRARDGAMARWKDSRCLGR
ncbi:hypothetical protein VTK73DRAFT_3782 [Phialemonium thermophilum]|uniref:Uncharacterized protein n=1 Tax=Phialemonium thermophilum TaxID=223376 RepID=A0ABR3VEV9_9PEZI